MYHLKHSFELKIRLLTSVTTSKVLPASAGIAFQCLLIITYDQTANHACVVYDTAELHV